MAVSTMQDDKKKALNLAIAQIEKSCGKGSIMKMGKDAEKIRVDFIPTGAINLDAAIGVGGVPRGRITEIYGPESSGKTTLCLHVVANAQRNGGATLFFTTFTRTCEPITSSFSFTGPMRRMSRRSDA